jgi:hypothetical protein
MDATDLPPSAFALPDDGRQKAHLCLARKVLTAALARHASADGSHCFPSKNTLQASTGMSHATIKRLLNDLAALGFLSNSGIHPRFRTAMRTLALPQPSSQNVQEGSSSSSGEKVEGSSSSSGGGPAHVQGGPGSSSGGSSSSSYPTATALLPLSLPLTHTPRKSVSENLDSFDQVAKYLELDMLTSQWKRGEKEQAEALIREHGWKKFYAVQRLYWEAQDPEQFSKTLFRWTGLLNSFAGLLQKVTPELLAYQDMDRFRKEHPEEWARIQDESMDRQTEELVRIKFTECSPKETIAECTMEEFFGKP